MSLLWKRFTGIMGAESSSQVDEAEGKGVASDKSINGGTSSDYAHNEDRDGDADTHFPAGAGSDALPDLKPKKRKRKSEMTLEERAEKKKAKKMKRKLEMERERAEAELRLQRSSPLRIKLEPVDHEQLYHKQMNLAGAEDEEFVGFSQAPMETSNEAVDEDGGQNGYVSAELPPLTKNDLSSHGMESIDQEMTQSQEDALSPSAQLQESQQSNPAREEAVEETVIGPPTSPKKSAKKNKKSRKSKDPVIASDAPAQSSSATSHWSNESQQLPDAEDNTAPTESSTQKRKSKKARRFDRSPEVEARTDPRGPLLSPTPPRLEEVSENGYLTVVELPEHSTQRYEHSEPILDPPNQGEVSPTQQKQKHKSKKAARLNARTDDESRHSPSSMSQPGEVQSATQVENVIDEEAGVVTKQKRVKGASKKEKSLAKNSRGLTSEEDNDQTAVTSDRLLTPDPSMPSTHNGAEPAQDQVDPNYGAEEVEPAGNNVGEIDASMQDENVLNGADHLDNHKDGEKFNGIDKSKDDDEMLDPESPSRGRDSQEVEEEVVSNTRKQTAQLVQSNSVKTTVNGFTAVNGGSSRIDNQSTKAKKRQTFLRAKAPLSSEQIKMHDVTPTLSAKGKGRGPALAWDPSSEHEQTDDVPQIGVYINPDSSGKKSKRRLPAELSQNSEGTPSAKRSKLSKATPKAKATPKPASASRKTQKEITENSEQQNQQHGGTTSGRFQDHEMDIITLELLKHREAEDMTEFDQNVLIQGSMVPAKEMWDQLSEALPDRQRQAIIKVCRRRFHNYTKRGRWSAEEDEELQTLNEKFPSKWQKIAEIMSRHPEDVRDRWRNYVICGPNLVKDRWNDAEEKALREAVDNCLYSVTVLKAREVKKNPTSTTYDKPDIEYVDWQVVSGLLGHTRNRLQCQAKWKQIVDREADQDNRLNVDIDFSHKSWRIARAKKEYYDMQRSEKVELLRAVKDSKASREGKVPWVLLEGKGLEKYSTMVKKMAWVKMRATVQGNRGMRMQDITEALLKRFGADGRSSGYTSDGDELEDTEDEDGSHRKFTKSEKFILDSDEDVNEDHSNTVKASLRSKRKSEASKVETPSKKSKAIKVSDSAEKSGSRGSRGSSKKKLIERMGTAEESLDRSDHDKDVIMANGQAGDVSDADMMNGVKNTILETPVKAPKSKSQRKKAKSAKRAAPIEEPSPLQTNGMTDENYDSSVADDNMADIPSGRREMSAEL